MASKKDRPTKESLKDGTGVNTTVEEVTPDKPVRKAVEAAPPKEEKKEVQKVDSKPERKLDPVRVEIFAATRMKPDQSAGFLHFAKKQKLEKRTMPEWQKAFEEFQKRRV